MRRLFKLHVALFALAVPLLARLLPLRWQLRLFTPPRRWTPYRGLSAEEIKSVVLRRLEKPRLMRRRICQRRGLTLFHFLSLSGIRSELRFGVYAKRPQQRRTVAHCWVTVDGEALADPPMEPCALVLVYPPPPKPPEA
ncbi:MAG: lasso peptide biosynthesis B2 protein [Candidatus Brocadiia bacterium]